MVDHENDDMTRLLLFQKVESNGVPFFKEALECKKGVLNLFLSKSGCRPQKSPKKKPKKRITQSRFTQIFE